MLLLIRFCDGLDIFVLQIGANLYSVWLHLLIVYLHHMLKRVHQVLIVKLIKKRKEVLNNGPQERSDHFFCWLVVKQYLIKGFAGIELYWKRLAPIHV